MKLLDCTIRDGGYYTNWDFSDQMVNTYIKTFNELPMDYLEVGYRSKPQQGYLGKYFYCPIYVLEELKAKTNKKLVIILNEKDVRAEDAEELLAPIRDYVTMVRMAIDPKNFERSLSLAKEVKKLGFEVSFNVMYMSTWKDQKGFLELIPEVDQVADYFYMVDSFGGVYPQDVKDTIALVRSKTKVKLGFHGHNNLEMALANTLTAIDEGIDIVDATVTGMGRGAGNLKTELLLTVLQSQNKLSFDYNALTKVVDGFTKLQSEYDWGPNLPYMVSGANSLPQKQVMEWVSKRYYSFNSIIRALNNQSQGRVDNEALSKLDKQKSHPPKAIIVGGGPSIKEYSKAIKLYLKQQPNMLVIHASSKNALSFLNIPNQQVFCLVGNEGHRLEEVFGEQPIKGKCILPPYPRKMGTFIPKALFNNAYELTDVNFTDKYKDSHTAIALQTALDYGVNEIEFVGYDGYHGQISKQEQDLFIENEYMFKAVSNMAKVKAITPTYYSKIEHQSIFALIHE